MPSVESQTFFHSKSLFDLYKNTPRHHPIMAIAHDEGGNVIGVLLAVVRSRFSWIPPYLYWHCRILGEGEYRLKCGIKKEEVFDDMLKAITHRVRHKVLYVEVSDISTKMFGYKVFRSNGYFPVRWMSIHNSLHSMPPEDRMTERTLRHISHASDKGITITEATSPEDVRQAYKLLHSHNRLKPKRFIPKIQFFKQLAASDNGHLMLTRLKGTAIGCSAIVYSRGNAYLWYAAFLRKRFLTFHPDEMTIWGAIKKAKEDGCRHIYFMDVGLPFRRNSFREFILRFGGKPVSTYRWFMVTNSILNRLLSWLYSD